MQDSTIDPALENAGLVQVEHTFDEHLRAAVEPGRERCVVHGNSVRCLRPQGRDQIAKLVVVVVAQDEALATASPSEPMPICNVPPSGTKQAAYNPAA